MGEIIFKAEKQESKKMQIKGYASLFNKADLSGDLILPQAFTNCLSRRPPQAIKMLLHHDVTKPVGCWRVIKSDHKGLWVEGEIATRSHQGYDLAALIEAEALDGLSIGFRAVKSVLDRARCRHISEVDLLEISFVTFPMQTGARLSLGLNQSLIDTQSLSLTKANLPENMCPESVLPDMKFLIQRIRRCKPSPVSHS